MLNSISFSSPATKTPSFQAIKGKGVTTDGQTVNIDLQPISYNKKGSAAKRNPNINITGNPKDGMQINSLHPLYSNTYISNYSGEENHFEVIQPGENNLFPGIKFKKIKISEVGPEDKVELGNEIYIEENTPHVEFESLKANEPWPEKQETGLITIHHRSTASFDNVTPNSIGEGLLITSDSNLLDTTGNNAKIETIFNGVQSTAYKIQGDNFTVKEKNWTKE